MALNSSVIYRGWTITAGCLPLASTDDQVLHFTGRAVAKLVDRKQERGWTDLPLQTATIFDRVFESREACLTVLVAQAKSLIDALQRPQSICEPPYGLYAKMIRAG